MFSGKEILSDIIIKFRSFENSDKSEYAYTYAQNNYKIQIHVFSIDKIGIILSNLSMSKFSDLQTPDIINKILKKQSDQILEKITYLLENFQLIELDTINKRAQLRSYPPYKENGSKYFYEIVLDEGIRIHFQRYEYSEKETRYKKINSNLTKEVFIRLINDLSSII